MWITQQTSSVCLDTHQINYANVIPALHNREKRDKHGDDPAASQHQRNAQRGHLVPIDQRLAADGIIPGERREQVGPWQAGREGREKGESRCERGSKREEK